ncbi:uncharacterized protein LOC127633392 [Xyrauchen texanus]|uniref:uncharacterized protein LOC127633392 n=1 Tax=Xyrauchen texanus TaxID=154827 RepID=UPI0022426327|nr:uncharacterized protein LOC127633392 [Xyrauchen texanus]
MNGWKQQKPWLMSWKPKKLKRKGEKKGTDVSNVSWRKRDQHGNILPQRVRKNRSVKPAGTRELSEVEEVEMNDIPQEVPSLDQHLQRLKNLLTSVTVSASVEVEETPTMSAWTKRQCVCLQICSCGPNQDFKIIPGKQTVLVTINGPYNLCLPCISCPLCSSKWTSGISDLLEYRYWPATSSCQMLFKFDLFTSFEQMKLASPALSQQAFIRMLEHRSLCTGQTGSICGDTFHRVFREFAFCNFKKDLCLLEPFKCPACTPDMLAISADGNRKHYWFKNSKGPLI